MASYREVAADYFVVCRERTGNHFHIVIILALTNRACNMCRLISAYDHKQLRFFSAIDSIPARVNIPKEKSQPAKLQ